jgi:hypothetical protein
MREISPFRLMWTLFHGLLLSLLYGLVSFAILWHVGGKSEAQPFFVAYTSQFKDDRLAGLDSWDSNDHISIPGCHPTDY